jgi:hypothetical protein
LADLDRLYEAVKAKGKLDIVFANAGIAEFAPLGKITEKHFDKLFHNKTSNVDLQERKSNERSKCGEE